MRIAALLLTLSLLLTVSGCLLFPAPPPFFKQIDVDVLRPGPAQPLLAASLPRTDYTVGEDLPLSVAINLPERELKEASLRIELLADSRKQPLHAVPLAHLRAGALKLTFDSASLPPGGYTLNVILTPANASPTMQSLSFTLIRKTSGGET